MKNILKGTFVILLISCNYGLVPSAHGLFVNSKDRLFMSFGKNMNQVIQEIITTLANESSQFNLDIFYRDQAFQSKLSTNLNLKNLYVPKQPDQEDASHYREFLTNLIEKRAAIDKNNDEFFPAILIWPSDVENRPNSFLCLDLLTGLISLNKKLTAELLVRTRNAINKYEKEPTRFNREKIFVNCLLFETFNLFADEYTGILFAIAELKEKYAGNPALIEVPVDTPDNPNLRRQLFPLIEPIIKYPPGARVKVKIERRNSR